MPLNLLLLRYKSLSQHQSAQVDKDSLMKTPMELTSMRLDCPANLESYPQDCCSAGTAYKAAGQQITSRATRQHRSVNLCQVHWQPVYDATLLNTRCTTHQFTPPVAEHVNLPQLVTGPQGGVFVPQPLGCTVQLGPPVA